MPRKKREILDEIERRITGSDLLSDEEKEAVRQKAREHVAKSRKDKAMDALLAQAIKLEEQEYDPQEQLEDFYVDLPEYAPCIKINDVMYFHGIVYEVPYSRARDMAHIQYRAWCHEREWKEGKSPLDMNRAPRLMHLSPANPNGRVTTTASLRDRG